LRLGAPVTHPPAPPPTTLPQCGASRRSARIRAAATRRADAAALKARQQVTRQPEPPRPLPAGGGESEAGGGGTSTQARQQGRVSKGASARRVNTGGGDSEAGGGGAPTGGAPFSGCPATAQAAAPWRRGAGAASTSDAPTPALPPPLTAPPQCAGLRQTARASGTPYLTHASVARLCAHPTGGTASGLAQHRAHSIAFEGTVTAAMPTLRQGGRLHTGGGEPLSPLRGSERPRPPHEVRRLSASPVAAHPALRAAVAPP